MQATLVIPELIPSQRTNGLLDIYRDLKCPGLEFLLGRAVRENAPGTCLEAWLCHFFGVEGTPDLPVAALSLLGEHGAPDEAFWIRADPVHLRTLQDRLVLTEAEQLAVSRPEAEALVESCSAHFAENGISFHALHPQRWYARLPTALDATTQPLPIVIGRNIAAYLPEGSQGGKLRALINETQMLLHAHPINQAREALGMLPINSIWLWGLGRLPAMALAPVEHVWGNHPVAQGLAAVAHVLAAELPTDADVWLSQRGMMLNTHMLVLDQLNAMAAHGDFDGWRKQLRTLERTWFAPLARAYCRGVIHSVDIHAISPRHCTTFTLKPRSRWKLWCRAKSLKHYAPAP